MLGPLQVKGPPNGAVQVTDNNGNAVIIFDDPVTLAVVSSSIVTLPSSAAPDGFSYRTVWASAGTYRFTVAGESSVYVDSYVTVNSVPILDPTMPYFGFKSGDNITPFVNALKAMSYQGLTPAAGGALNIPAGAGPVMYIPSVSSYSSPWLCDQVTDLPDTLVIKGQHKQMSVVQATSGIIEALWSFQATTFRRTESSKNIIEAINVQGNGAGMTQASGAVITLGSYVVSGLPTSWFTGAVDQWGPVGIGDLLEGWGLPPLSYITDVPVSAGGSQPPGQVLVSALAVCSNQASGAGVTNSNVIRRKGWRVACNVTANSNTLTTTTAMPWLVRGLRIDGANAGGDRRVVSFSTTGGVTTIIMDAAAPGNTVAETIQFHVEPRGLYFLNASTSPFSLLPGANTTKGARSCFIYNSIFDAFAGTGLDSEPGRDEVHCDNCVGNSNGRGGIRLVGVNDVKASRPGFNGNWGTNVTLQGAATYKLVGPGDVSDSINNFVDQTTGLHNAPEIVFKGGQQGLIENIDNNGVLYVVGGLDQYVPGDPTKPTVYKLQLNNYNGKLNPGNRNSTNGGATDGSGYGPKAAIIIKNCNVQGSGVDPYSFIGTGPLKFDYFVQFLDSDSIATFSNIQLVTEPGSLSNPFAIGLTNSTTNQLRATYDDLTTGEQAETAVKRFDNFVSLGAGLAMSASSQVEVSPVNNSNLPLTPSTAVAHLNKTGGAAVANFQLSLWDLPRDGQTHFIDGLTAITALGFNVANNAGYNGSSTTSLVVAAGAIGTTVSVASNKPYVKGQRILITSAGSGATLTGIVQPSAGTGLVTFLVDGYSGAGTYADWNLSIAVPWSVGVSIPTTIPPGTGFVLTYNAGTSNPGWKVFLNTTKTGASSGLFTPTIGFQTTGDLSVAYTKQFGSYHVSNGSCQFRAIVTFTPTYTTAAGNLQVRGSPVIPNAAYSTPALCANTSGPTAALGTGFSTISAVLNSAGVANVQKGGGGQTLTALGVAGFPSGGTYTIEIWGTFDV